MHIGVAGLGAMGAPIAARLLEVGHQVTVWNRSAEKTKPLAEAGAKVAKTPAEVASACEAVITILTDGGAIDAVVGANDHNRRVRELRARVSKMSPYLTRSGDGAVAGIDLRF